MEEQSEFCSTCKKFISAANFTSHSAFCERNVTICEVCEEPIYKEMFEEHEAKYHVSKVCDQCFCIFKIWKLKKHKEECPERLVLCEFCSTNFPFKKFAEHVEFCESRTEKCPSCSKYIMLKDKKKHAEFHQHKEKNSNEDGDGEADVIILNDEEVKKFRPNYLPRNFMINSPGTSNQRTIQQNGVHNVENVCHNIPHNVTYNFFPYSLMSGIKCQHNNSSAASSSASAQPTKKRLGIIDPLTGKNILSDSDDEETPETIKKPQSIHSFYPGLIMPPQTSKYNLIPGNSNNMPRGASNTILDFYPAHPSLAFGMNSQRINSSQASSTQPTKKRLAIIDPLTGKDMLSETITTEVKTSATNVNECNDTVTVCPNCQLFISRKDLDLHLKKCSPNCNPKVCPYCNKYETSKHITSRACQVKLLNEQGGPSSFKMYRSKFLSASAKKDKDRDVHLSSQCKMLQEEMPSDFYTCQLCFEVLPRIEKTIHDFFKCKVLIEANKGILDSPFDDGISVLGIPTGAEAMPASAQGIPTGAQGIPTGAQGIPTGAQGIPTGATAMPASAQGIPTFMNNIHQLNASRKYKYVKGLLGKTLQEQQDDFDDSDEAEISFANCPKCYKFIRWLDYNNHVPSCRGKKGSTREELVSSSTREELVSSSQKNKSEAELKAKAKFERTLKFLTTDFCNERKLVAAPRNEKKHGSDSNESGSVLRAKQPCKIKLGNYPIFSFAAQAGDPFGLGAASQSTSQGISNQIETNTLSGAASQSTSQGISSQKETNTLSENDSEAKGSPEDDGIWSPTVKLPKCIICVTNERNITFQPCGHLVTCSNCSYTKMNDCPVCRKPIRGKLKTYIS